MTVHFTYNYIYVWVIENWDQPNINVLIITHFCAVIIYYFYKIIICSYINKLLKNQLREN